MPNAKTADIAQLGPRLDAILDALRDLAITDGARSGMSRDQVRKMLGVGPATVTRVWKHIKEGRRQREVREA